MIGFLLIVWKRYAVWVWVGYALGAVGNIFGGCEL
jgi:hypothetical protein